MSLNASFNVHCAGLLKENHGGDTRGKRICINGALITIFTDLYDRARSNVLSNAYLTVHRIGHTRDTAIACY